MSPHRRISCWAKPLLGALGSVALCASSVAAADKPAKGAAAADKTSKGISIPFRTDRAGVVSINVYGQDGLVVRRLIRAERMAAGPHSVLWDRLGEDGKPVADGDYTWRGIIHDGIGLKLRGWAGNSGSTPWPTADGKGDWGGDAGVPSAVAADAQKVYLGWSLAERGKSIAACDLEGRIQWAHRRTEGPSGCEALCVDNGILYVLGGLAGVGAEGGCIYRLNAKDGKPVPWPNGKLDLKIAAFWPADASTKPETADAMAVRHDRIYLSFTKSEFMTVLDAKTGAYLQTVVGLPPGKLDVAPTQTNLPDQPDKVVDADFALIEINNGLLGKVLFAHDPLWVVTSTLVPMNTPLPIAALTIIGDAGKFHRHHAFIGLGAPYHVVQARSLLDTDELLWMAGKPGGRPESGPWQPNSLRNVRAVALAADGKLWAAEGDGFPKRFSVWDTTGQEGKLVKEFFGPTGSNNGRGAINPLDSDLMFAQGCEWRLDRVTGKANCLGTVTREGRDGRYAVGENGNVYLIVGTEEGVEIFERIADGDYKLRAAVFSSQIDRVTGQFSDDKRSFAWADENGDGQIQAGEVNSVANALKLGPQGVLQDLTLSCSSGHPAARGHIFKVKSWSPCAAPRYDLTAGLEMPGKAYLSADGKSALLLDSAGGSEPFATSCVDVASGQIRWAFPKGKLPGFPISSSAYLPAPIGNVWLLKRGANYWLDWDPTKETLDPISIDTQVLINEDGFELGAVFASPNEKSIRWPKSAAPGADMSDAYTTTIGSLTQAADGKLYLPTGDSAVWNLEVTGLETAKALPGGVITVAVAPVK